MRDSLLDQFTITQREYIIDKIYPDLQRALVHFIAEAKRLNKIIERADLAANNLSEGNKKTKEVEVQTEPLMMNKGESKAPRL